MNNIESNYTIRTIVFFCDFHKTLNPYGRLVFYQVIIVSCNHVYNKMLKKVKNVS